MLLLLIENDEAGITGGKHRAAGAHHHSGISLADTLPLIIPLGGRQIGVENRHLLPEIGRQKAQELGGQRNFGNQEHGTPSPIQRCLDELDIDRGLSRSGDTVQ